jgi:hypothetical protein
MATTLKNAQAGLSGAGTQDTLITATVETIVKTINLVNYSGSTIVVKLWVGGTGDTNLILPPTTMDAGDYGIFNGEIVLQATDTLKAESDTASACAVTVSYLEIA